MYESFFSMKHRPFCRGIPVGELYCDRETDEILNRLKYASQNQLFAVLIGEPGMGKTTMLRHLKEEMEGTEYAVLYLSDSQMTPRSFYNSLLEQLGCDTKFQRSAARRSLHQELEVMRGISHQKVIVIVGEGHLLPKETLEEIRFLLNYKMDSENPLAPIISGQTELWDKLKRQTFRAIRHRIDIECFMLPYDYSQTRAYIERQIQYAKHDGPIFSEGAMKRIYEFSGGIPRLINRACTQSLTYAYQSRCNIVDDRMVDTVLEAEVS